MPAKFADDLVMNGVKFRICSNCMKWKRDFEFQLVKDKRSRSHYRARYCKTCKGRFKSEKARPNLIVRGRVPVSSMIPKIDYMLNVVGFNDTWKRIGVSSNALSRWKYKTLNAYKRETRQMSALSALKVLKAFVKLKNEVKTGKVIPRTSNFARDLCPGCGGTNDNVTHGCVNCWDRARSKRRYQSSKEL